MVTSFNTTLPGKTGSNTLLIVGCILAAAGIGYWHFVWKPEQAAKLAAQPKQ